MTIPQKKVWQFIFNNIIAKKEVVLLFVLESSGSSPGRQGFLMAVNMESAMEGSIGGGIMEYKLVELAKEYLQKNKPIHEIKKQLHHKSTGLNQSGMICSGEQTVFLYTLNSTDSETILQMMTQEKNSILCISPNGISIAKQSGVPWFEYRNVNDTDWTYREKLGFRHRLHIIGGGHCSLALCKLMQGMDFFITVYDHRENLSTIKKNEFANNIQLLQDYAELGTMLHEDPEAFVIIMTLGYRTDSIAFIALCQKKFRYVKMLGSQKKLEKLADEFSESNSGSAGFSMIAQPAGLPINSKTPEEIAISIAAEIIALKNSVNN
jgi:xanthine dehydrogenase accessory factor